VTQAREGVRAERAMWIESLAQDLHHSVRSLRRSPRFP
jgi:hypothetical protein